MPELPEVETMVRGIRETCENRRLERVEFPQTRNRPIAVSPDRGAVSRVLKNRTLLTTGRLGKRVLLEFEGTLTLVVEPRMTGLLALDDVPTPEHVRVIWHFAGSPGRWPRVRFWDRRGLGTISLCNADEMLSLRRRLGPDALAMTQTDWKLALSGTSRAIKVALLDQSLVAGIGNLYASEILHVAGVSPCRIARQLKPAEIGRIAKATIRVLNDAIRCEGSTLGDGTYRNALNSIGDYQNHHRVYQKQGEKCDRCRDSVILRIVQAQRSTFYCPSCQK